MLRVQGALVTSARDEARHRALEAPGQARVPRGPAREPGRRRTPSSRQQAAGGDELLADAIKTVVNTGAAWWRCCSAACASATPAPAASSTSWRRWASSPGYDGSKARSVLIDEAGLPTALARLSGDVVDEPAAAPDERRRRRGAGGAACGGRAGARRPLSLVAASALVCLRRTRLLDCTFGRPPRPDPQRRARRTASTVFEIGTTLREARVRRNLTLQQVEEDTKIRVKYVQAMENEDFDVMPGVDLRQGLPAHLLHLSRPRPRRHHRGVPLARHGAVGGAPRAVRRLVRASASRTATAAATPSSSSPSSASRPGGDLRARHAERRRRQRRAHHQARRPRHRQPVAVAEHVAQADASRTAVPAWQKNLVKVERRGRRLLDGGPRATTARGVVLFSGTLEQGRQEEVQGQGHSG